MAFASYDDAINQVTDLGQRSSYFFAQVASVARAGARWFSNWSEGFRPSVGLFSGSALAAQVLSDASAGAIPHGGNVSPAVKHLSYWNGSITAATAIPSYLLLYDRLLYYPGIDAATTSPQTLTNATTLTRYTTGAGVMMFMEVTTALGTGTGTITCSYTNSDGTAGRSFGGTVQSAASSSIRTLPGTGLLTSQEWNPWLPLQAGDVGVRSVQTITFTGAHSAGVVALVLARPICYIPIGVVSQFLEREKMFELRSLERIFDGACLNFLHYQPAGTLAAGAGFLGQLDFVWG